MSFDKIFDLTAGVYFHLYIIRPAVACLLCMFRYSSRQHALQLLLPVVYALPWYLVSYKTR